MHDLSLHSLIGQERVSPWIDVTQDAIARFADLTGDRQWIHVDSDRAGRESPFGTTVAHGFFTLALLSPILSRTIGSLDGVRMGVNYGLNKVRFPSPVPAGSRVRGRVTLQRVDPVEGALQATWSVIVERAGADKPCCAAEWVVRYYR
jgi:acyl dehydratase